MIGPHLKKERNLGLFNSFIFSLASSLYVSTVKPIGLTLLRLMLQFYLSLKRTII